MSDDKVVPLWPDQSEALLDQSFPQNVRHTGRFAGLRCVWDESFQGILVYDNTGFLTSVMTRETLWELIQSESTYPGFCRERLRKKREAIGSNARELTEAQMKSALREAEERNRIKRYNSRGKEIQDLPEFADLDLEIEEEGDPS